MIFKVIETSLIGATNKIGIFNRSFADLKNAIMITNSNGVIKNGIGGLFNNLSSVITTRDLSNIAEYNRLVGVEGVSSQTAWNRTMLSSSAAAQNLFNDEKNLVRSGNGVVLSQNAITRATDTMTLSAKAANVAMKALAIAGNMLTFMAIAKGIQLASEALDHLINREKYAQEALENAINTAKEYKDAISDIQSETKNTKKSVNEIASAYAKLSQGIDTFTNENTGLTNEDYEEFLNLNNQLAELFPSLTKKYDENGNAILGLGGSVESVTSKISALVEQQERLAKIEIHKSLESYVNGDEENGGQLKALEGLEKNVLNAEKELNGLDEKYNAVIAGSKVNEDILDNQIDEAKDYYKNAFGLTDEEIQDAIYRDLNVFGEGVYRFDFSNLEIDESRKDKITEAYNSFYKGLNDNLLYAKTEFDTANQEMSSMMMMWVEDEAIYKKGGETLQILIQNMISGINWNQLEISNYDEAKNWLKTNIFSLISSVDENDKTKLSNSLNKILSLDLSELSIMETRIEVEKYLNEISQILGQENANILKIGLGFDNIDELKTKYNEAVNKFADDSVQTLDDVNTKYQEVIDNEYQKIQDWGLGNYAQQIKDGTIQSVFGNVDMDKRTIITWSDELKQTYKDALDSWDYDPEVGGIDTVWGGSDRFGEDLNEVGWQVAFTPILPDGTFLNKDSVYDYIETILQEAYENDGKVTEGELTEIDAKGRQIGDTFIKGIFAGIDDSQNYDNNGNWAETVGRLLHFSGDFGAVEIAKREKEKAIKEFSDSNVDLEKFFADNSINTTEEIDYWNKVTECANSAKEAVEMYNKAKGENPDEITVLPDISQTIDNLNTRLKPTMDALKEAYQNIFKSEDGKIKFSLDDVDISTFESIKSAIGELDEIEGIEINYDDFDNFVKVLSDTSSTSDEVQDQFDKLATSIVYSSDCTEMSKDNFDLLCKSLYEMGLTNAPEVLRNIRTAQEELKASGINLTNVTAEEAEAFINEAEASDIAIQYLRMYMLQKELANDNQLDTTESIQSLKKLCEQLGMTCNALGKTSELMQAVLSLESATNAIAAGVDYSGQYARQAEDAKKKIEDIKNGNFEDYNYNFNSNVTSPSSSNGSGSSKEDKQSKETIDFIEIAIKRIEEAIDKLKTKAENTFIGFEIRTKHYASLLGKVTDEINLQSQAYQAYMARANSVGLSEVYASQIRDGSLNIVDITDDKLKEQIKDYQTWYEKAKECQDKVEELKITQTELTQANLELLITKYEKLAEKVSSANDRIQGKLDLKEAWGFHATSGSYTSMNKNIIKQIDYIKKQDEELKKLLNTVEKGSEAWLEYQARLDDNKKSLQDLTKEMAENAKAAAELSGAKAERKVEKYDKSDEKLDAKIDNSIKYKNQNKYLNTEMNNIDRRQKAYDKAVETDKKGIKSTSKAINKTKSNKENKSILKKIKSLVKQKKKIPESLLKQTSKLGGNNALYDKCVRYNAYISAYEIDKDIADLYRETSQQDKADLAQRKLDNIKTYYKNRQGENNQKAEQLNARIEMAKESGYVESATLYNQLSSVEKQNNASLRTERDKLQESLAKSLLDGSIKKNSDEWYEMCQKIDDVTNEIDQSDLALKQYQNTLRQMKWDSFDYLQGKISNVTSEMDFMINELSRKDLTSDDIGGLTDEGNGVAYLRASKYETLKNQLADYYAELETLEKTEDQYDTKVIERKEELRQSIQDTTSAVQDEKWAIIDLYTQGYEALSNKIKDLIDEYGELLDAEKEAYDWQNTIADKTKEIASIRKQLSAYANDSSEETKAKIQQLNVSLEEAEKDLKDSQYDKFISDTKDMLSDLQEDMDNNIQSIIDNLDKNFEELMASIGENATTSAETVKSAMTGIGYQPSEDFSTMLSTTLEGSSIKVSVDKMITGIDNLVEILKKRAEENAKGADTTTASEDVKEEAISKQQGKVDTKKEKYEKALEEYNKAKKETSKLKTKMDDIGWIYGIDSKKYKNANEKYKQAKKNRDTLKSSMNSAKKEYEDELAELEKLKKYSVGSKHITKDQLAWTQDGGQELVYRSNDGAILTRLGEGDKVFTNEMSENLWKLAQIHPADFMNGIGNVKLPDVTRNVTGGDVRIEFGDLVLPDVTNSAEFANSVEGVMRNAICKNGKTAKCFTEAVSSMQMGRGIGNARLYK